MPISDGCAPAAANEIGRAVEAAAATLRVRVLRLEGAFAAPPLCGVVGRAHRGGGEGGGDKAGYDNQSGGMESVGRHDEGIQMWRSRIGSSRCSSILLPVRLMLYSRAIDSEHSSSPGTATNSAVLYIHCLRVPPRRSISELKSALVLVKILTIIDCRTVYD